MVENSKVILKRRWAELIAKLGKQFDGDPDLQAILFLIGVNELGQGMKKFSKAEKQDLMHIAVCKVLSRYGYYTLEGSDEEGWPHWKLEEKIPPLGLAEQDQLLKQGVVDYFEEINYFISD
jgi:hypothetical protein